QECRQWCEHLASLMPRPEAVVPAPVEKSAARPVVLLRHRPLVRFQLLGAVEAQSPKRWHAAAGLRLRGAVLGADAIVDVQEERLPQFDRTLQRQAGTAVRAVDRQGRMEFASRWYADQVKAIATWMIVMCFLFMLFSLPAALAGGLLEFMSNRQ